MRAAATVVEAWALGAVEGEDAIQLAEGRLSNWVRVRAAGDTGFSLRGRFSCSSCSSCSAVGRRSLRDGLRTITGWVSRGLRTAAGSFQSSGEHHHDVLAGSAFSRLEAALFERRLTRRHDEVVGLQLSYSYCSPARLGDRLAAFTEAAGAALEAENPSGEWEERVVTEVLIARRP